MRQFKTGDLVKIKNDPSNKIWKIIGIPTNAPINHEQVKHPIEKYPMYLIGNPKTELEKKEISGENLTLVKPD